MSLCRTVIGKHAFRMSVPIVWNALPSGARLSDSLPGRPSYRRLETTLFICVFNSDSVIIMLSWWPSSCELRRYEILYCIVQCAIISADYL